MKILGFFVVILLFLIIYVRSLEYTSLFHPTRRILSTPRDVGLSYEDIYFSTEDHVRLNGWLVRAPANSETAATLIFCHGNAGNMGDRIEKIENFRQLGLNVFIFDYRGYGQSQGRPTEQGMYRDGEAAFDYLRSRNDIDPEKIVVYGASLGGAAAVDVASKRPVAGLILDSTFPSAVDMGKVLAPFVPSWLIAIKFDSAAKIKNVTAPKLFIHSPDDEVVPYDLGKKLYNMSPGPKEFLNISGNHNEGYSLSLNVFVKGVREFLTTHQLL